MRRVCQIASACTTVVRQSFEESLRKKTGDEWEKGAFLKEFKGRDDIINSAVFVIQFDAAMKKASGRLRCGPKSLII